MLESGQATEPSYYPALKSLLEALDAGIMAVNNPRKILHGAPDFSVRRKGNVLEFPVGWIEAKEIGHDLDREEKSEQLKRYRHLPNLILTDFLEFRWYRNGESRLVKRLGSLEDGRLRMGPEGEASVRELELPISGSDLSYLLS